MRNKKQNKRRTKRNYRCKLSLERLEDKRMLAVAFGDFNQDGYQDMAVGAPREDFGVHVDGGSVNVIYGSPSGLNSGFGQQLLHQNRPLIYDETEADDLYGSALAVGDFDRDGYDDLAIGVPGEDIGKIEDAGAVSIVYGSAIGLSMSRDQFLHQDLFGIGDISEARDRFGSTLSTGDYNGDGFSDLAIGVPNENFETTQDAGLVHVLYGGTRGIRFNGSAVLDQSTSGLEDWPERYDHFGAALASGDFNNDGKDDLAIGVPGENVDERHDTGALHVVYGSAAGVNPLWQAYYTQDSPYIPEFAEQWDRFGAALTAADFDNDGFADLAVGAPGESIGAIKQAGLIHAMYGTTGTEFNRFRHTVFSQRTTGILDGAELVDYFGAALDSGDLNGDGFADVVVGIPGESIGEEAAAGAIQLIYGSATGVQAAGNRFYHQDSAGVADSAELADFFGAELAVADIDGDGWSDIAVAVPGEDLAGLSDAGGVHVFEGTNAFSIRTDNDRLWWQGASSVLGSGEASDRFGGDTPSMLRYSVPEFQSNPGAPKHLQLVFEGGISDGKYTPFFSLDNEFGFNETEQALIEDIWAYVSEDYAPFEINVTTIDPRDGGEVFRVFIGGDGTEREDDPTSGVAPGHVSFTDGDPNNNDVYAFSDGIQAAFGVDDNLAARIGTTASHESGHGFDLNHKNTVDSSGSQLEEYSSGNTPTDPGLDWTPIMGGNLNTDRTIWAQASAPIIGTANSVRGDNDFSTLMLELGLRPEDHVLTHLGTASPGRMLTDIGLIRTINDRDVFSFTVTAAADYTIDLRVADVGANLDSILTLYTDSNVFIAQNNSGLSTQITEHLTPGTYHAEVRSEAIYTGDVGTYTIRVEGAALEYALPVFVPGPPRNLIVAQVDQSPFPTPANFPPIQPIDNNDPPVDPERVRRERSIGSQARFKRIDQFFEQLGELDLEFNEIDK